MSKIDYSKWDKLGDTSDEEEEMPPPSKPVAVVPKPNVQQNASASVASGFDDEFGVKSSRKRFRLHFKADSTGSEHEIYVNAEDFAKMSDRFAAIYKGLGSPVDGSVLVEDENPTDFKDFIDQIHASFTHSAREHSDYDELWTNLTDQERRTRQKMKSAPEMFNRLLPIYQRWSTPAEMTAGLCVLCLNISDNRRLVPLPHAVELLYTLCDMRKNDDGKTKLVQVPSACTLSTSGEITLYNVSIGAQLRHRITQLVIYMAEFKTTQLKAAGIERLPDNVKEALFYLAKEVETGKKIDPTRVPNRFLRILNDTTEQPSIAPDAFSLSWFKEFERLVKT